MSSFRAVCLVAAGVCVASGYREKVELAAALEATHAEGSNSTQASCPECPVMSCDGKYMRYTLLPQPGVETGFSSGKYYTLTLGKGTASQASVTVILDMLYGEGTRGGVGGYAGSKGTGNCFAFATHSDYQVPGGSPEIISAWRDKDPYKENGASPVDTVHRKCGVQDKCLGEAMEMREGAFFLGKDLNSVQLPLVNRLTQQKLGDDPEQKYYLIAAFMTPLTDYHFWGLFRDVGWACVPSKVASSSITTLTSLNGGLHREKGEDGWQLAEQCGFSSSWVRMNKKGGYNPRLKHVGFYLFPCRRNC